MPSFDGLEHRQLVDDAARLALTTSAPRWATRPGGTPTAGPRVSSPRAITLISTSLVAIRSSRSRYVAPCSSAGARRDRDQYDTGQPIASSGATMPWAIGPKPTIPTRRPPISIGPAGDHVDLRPPPGAQLALHPVEVPGDAEQRAEHPLGDRRGVEPGGVGQRDAGGVERGEIVRRHADARLLDEGQVRRSGDVIGRRARWRWPASRRSAARPRPAPRRPPPGRRGRASTTVSGRSPSTSPAIVGDRGASVTRVHGAAVIGVMLPAATVRPIVGPAGRIGRYPSVDGRLPSVVAPSSARLLLELAGQPGGGAQLLGIDIGVAAIGRCGRRDGPHGRGFPLAPRSHPSTVGSRVRPRRRRRRRRWRPPGGAGAPVRPPPTTAS